MTAPGSSAVLVAGVGNVFLGDDGFGPAVVTRLLRDAGPLPASARVVDYGIRGVHLSYDLLDDWDTLVLVDLLAGGEGPPGTLRLFAVGEADLAGAPALDAHGLDPFAVLSSVRALGGRLPRRTLVLGCTAASVAERIGLSSAVAAAVDPAVAALRGLLAETVPTPAGRS